MSNPLEDSDDISATFGNMVGPPMSGPLAVTQGPPPSMPAMNLPAIPEGPRMDSQRGGDISPQLPPQGSPYQVSQSMASRSSNQASPVSDQRGASIRSASPVMFSTTAPVRQMQTAEEHPESPYPEQRNTKEEENALLKARAQQLEKSNSQIAQLLAKKKQALEKEVAASAPAEIAELQRLIRDTENKEAAALAAHEARLQEIRALEKHLLMLSLNSAEEETNQSVAQEAAQLQRDLQDAKDAVLKYHQAIQVQTAEIVQQKDMIQKAQEALDLKLILQRGIEWAEQDAVGSKAAAQATASEVEQLQQTHQILEKKLARLNSAEKACGGREQNEQKVIDYLQRKLKEETKAKEASVRDSEAQRERMEQLQGEVVDLKAALPSLAKQTNLHRLESMRLKKLQDMEEPPEPPILHFPLKDMEEKVVRMAILMMLGLCSMPIMAAYALLNDKTYMFWLGSYFPYLTIAGCVCVFVLFVVTVQVLLCRALPQHRSRHTMVLTWATFAALLGLILVPIGMYANKEAQTVASTVSQGCFTTMPQSEMLADYGQVLYNIRMSKQCTDEDSVEKCEGWSANSYTTYLQHLESEFQCGPLCPEKSPGAQAVKAPSIFNTPVPTEKPELPPPPLLGPPLQDALGKVSFLQSSEASSSKAQRRHRASAVSEERRALALPTHDGIMSTSGPHMQARKLFSKGTTRMECYPLISTRLQVLTSTFSGLWYWEGIALVFVSLMTSVYAATLLSFGKAPASAATA